MDTILVVLTKRFKIQRPNEKRKYIKLNTHNILKYLFYFN
ncbi:hypothetical protein HPDP_00038 [Candidatus Hepatincola sp. Pdp]